MTGRTLRQRLEDWIADPGAQLSRWGRLLRAQLALGRMCARRLRENNVLALSAALSFRTIFALIPVLIFAFLILRSVGVVEDGKRSLREFLRGSGLAQIAVRDGPGPATGPAPADPGGGGSAPAGGEIVNIADQIEQLVAETESKLTFQRIGPVGAVLLIWTALTLLITLEQSLNRIFGAPRNRALTRRIVLYWSAITLGPVTVVAVSYFSNLAIRTSAEVPGLSSVTAVLGRIAPVLVGILVVALAYKLIPNTGVPLRAALAGAVVAVPLWLLARWAFALYVDRFVLKGHLYGVLGVVPLFLLWLNLSWTIFLFGAQFAHTAANLARLEQAERADRRPAGPSEWLAVALAVARQFAAGRGAATFEQIVALTEAPGERVRPVLHGLIDARVITPTDEHPERRYLLSRPAAQVRVADILELADPQGASTGAGESDGIRLAVRSAQVRSRAALEPLTLADLLATVGADLPAATGGTPPPAGAS